LSSQLYRSAALNARQVRWLGDIVLVRPLGFSFLTAIAGILAFIVIAFLAWGTYTKRSTVSGQLLPDSGLVKVYVPQPGIVLEKRVTEGQHVNQGDVLYVASTSQELTESEAKRRLLITAPETGTATAVVAEIGQAVDTGRPLVSIVPQGATLQAQLYAPSKAIGFIKPGDAVLLRYQAYPYQKFGHAQGRVAAVSKTALPSSELATIGSLAGSAPGANAEPLYRITVDLHSQTINAYGKPQPLQAGMLLEADVLQDTRRLYEWVLEPLYSLTGKL
jgi:multidrug efflux pump subunit AcrA (membrane-fusion protein)